jgi:hypothetical protein
MAGNPFYLASAGLLLYGINQLTTNCKLVGAEFPMLRFNFSALVLYEIMLVGTAILLIRRRIWYDALLLFGLANLFVIVPFSLISRAVFLSPHLALAMTICGAALAVAKFWAFKRYARELNLPGRLLFFGALLLLLNASAPLLFKHIAFDLDRIARWLTFIWEFLLPALAALAIFLPRPDWRTGRSALPISGGGPGEAKWLPVAVYFGWVIVTACHFGGIGYSNSYVWNVSLLVPIAWVIAWTAYARIKDFVTGPNRLAEQVLLSVPVLLPLLAIEKERILLLFSGLNLLIYGLLLIRKERNFLALTRLLGSIAIFCGGLPAPWISYTLPGVSRPEWIALSAVGCFFWVIFRFRDPRIAMFGTLSLVGLCCHFAPDLSHYAVQVALASLLAHSLCWDDQAHKGAATLRFLAGVIWSVVSYSWVINSVRPERLLIDSAAGALLIVYLFQVIRSGRWKHRIVPISASFVLLSEPATILGSWLNGETPGMLAVVASFLLFALGSIAAFSKPKWWPPGRTYVARPSPAAGSGAVSAPVSGIGGGGSATGEQRP